MTNGIGAAPRDPRVAEIQTNRGRRPPERLSGPRTRTILVLVVVVYGLLATLAYVPTWPGDPSHLPTCACGDPAQIVWFLRWTPFAILHAHNPLYTTFIEYPTGVNLAQNTSMPLLGVLSAPLSLLFGPVSSTTFMLWLAITSSASSYFFVLRRWVRWMPAAFIGGLFYGFSPYMVGQSTGHLNLLFVPLPPLILLALYELIVRQQGSSLRWGVALGLLAAAQFLVSPEIFLSSAMLAAVGALGIAIARPRLVRHHAAYAIRGLTGALLTCLPIIAYPALFNIFGPNGYVGSAQGSYPFPADVLGAVVPDVNQLVSTSSIASVGNRFVMGNVVENGSYLGIPLLILLVCIVVRWWRVGWVRFATCMAVVAWIISLGPRLTVNTHTTSIPLPFALFEHMPILPSLEVTRFSLYVDLFVALLFAIGIDRWQARALQSFVHRPRPERHRIGLTGVVVAAAVVIVASLLPNWPHPEFPTAVPTFFSSPTARRIPPGSVVLAYPYPDNPTIQAMLWQATDSMAFRLVGGYAVVPDAHRQASLNPFPPGSDEVPAALVGDYLGVHPSDVIAGLPPTAPTAAQVRSFLLANDVGTVIVQASGADPTAARRLFVRALGDPSTTTGGVDAWFDIGDSR